MQIKMCIEEMRCLGFHYIDVKPEHDDLYMYMNKEILSLQIVSENLTLCLNNCQ